jgi:hypothetical protein
MTVITGKEYYKAHISEEKEYLRVCPAYPIRKGEDISSNSQAPEDGYVVFNSFYTKQEFEAKTQVADNLSLPAPRHDLSAEQLAGFAPVSKGDKIEAFDEKTGNLIEQTARHDGFLIPYGDGKAFMTNFEFASSFNDVVKKSETEADPVIVIFNNNSKPVKGILIAEPTQLVLAGNYTQAAVAGDIICTDGQNVSSVFNLNYRLTEKWTAEAAMHNLALDNHAQLKKKSQEMKARKAALKG